MEVFSQVSYYTSFSRNSWDLSSSRANQKSKSVVSVGLEDNFCSDEAVGGLPQSGGGFIREGRMDYHHSLCGRFGETRGSP